MPGVDIGCALVFLCLNEGLRGEHGFLRSKRPCPPSVSLFRLRCIHRSETFSHDLLLGTEFEILTSVIEGNKFTP